MNASERQTVADIRQVMDSASMPKTAMYTHHVGKLLAILDRQEQLASEGLSELDVTRIGYWSAEYTKADFTRVIETLQAQLAAAHELRNLLLSDPPAEWQDVVLQVKAETAKECAEIAEELHRRFHGRTIDGFSVSGQIIKAINRRFNLAAPQAEPPKRNTVLANSCETCGGQGRINTGPGDYGDEYMACMTCNGTGRRTPELADSQYNERRDRRLEERLP